MANLIPSPDLDTRDEVQLAAEAIAHVSGGLTVERIDSQIERLQLARLQLLLGVAPPAICPELANANPSSPHVVILEAQAWLAEQQKRVLNLLPDKVRIEFANLFIEMREAQPATTTLEFSVAAEAPTPLTIAAGTLAGTEDNHYVFATDDEIVVAPGESGTVAATRTVAGAVQIALDQITKLSGATLYLSVTNPQMVDSGAEAETVEEALLRARHYQRRSERWVSSKDVEEGILEDVLFGNGLVRAFDLVEHPNWETRKPGHTTIIVMTRSGNPLSSELEQKVKRSLLEHIGSIESHIIGPQYVDFNVTASIVIAGLTSADVIKAAVEQNLRDFYAPRDGNFGRRISRSEVAFVIEGTQGVDRIASDEDGPIFASPPVDIPLAPYELPRLVNVTLTVMS